MATAARGRRAYVLWVRWYGLFVETRSALIAARVVPAAVGRATSGRGHKAVGRPVQAVDVPPWSKWSPGPASFAGGCNRLQLESGSVKGSCDDYSSVVFSFTWGGGRVEWEAHRTKRPVWCANVRDRRPGQDGLFVEQCVWLWLADRLGCKKDLPNS